MMTITSSTPMNNALVRLLIESSMKVAGRKIVVSYSTPGSPVAISAMVSSTFSVTSLVFAPRYFCTMSIRPSPSLMTPSPHSCWLSCLTVPRSDIRRTLPSRSATGTLASSSGPVIGCTFSMLSRFWAVSTKPPCPTVKLLAYCSTPASSASDPASMTVSIGMSYFSSRAGSTWTWRCLRRSP